MFEALRGLRDAVAPESGNLGNTAAPGSGNNNNNSNEPDWEDLWHAYRKGDPGVLAMIAKTAGNNKQITRREDFVRLHAKMEMEKDTELVLLLAKSVLDKSQEIDEQVAALPGMDRTRSQQMNRIKELIEFNQQASVELEEAFSAAKKRRDASRKFVQENTCRALGIEEDDNILL